MHISKVLHCLCLKFTVYHVREGGGGPHKYASDEGQNILVNDWQHSEELDCSNKVLLSTKQTPHTHIEKLT